MQSYLLIVEMVALLEGDYCSTNVIQLRTIQSYLLNIEMVALQDGG